MYKLSVITTVAAAFACAAFAQTASPLSPPLSTESSASVQSTPASTKLSKADRSFMRDAAFAGTAEVKASQLAVTKASDPQVKEFAQKMIADHTEANNKLKRLAASKGVTLPTEPSPTQQKSIQSLEGKAGSNFDRQFMDEFGTKAHHEAVGLFREEVQSGEDSDVKSFAVQTLPTLEKHLQHAAHVSK